MFVINITYKKDLREIDRHLAEHRTFLDEQYQKGLLLMSGPQDPRAGGIIIALGNDKRALEHVFAKDPFVANDIAIYEYIKFDPVKYHDAVKTLVS